MRNFQDIIFIWIETYRKIFKSALVYLKNTMQNAITAQSGIYLLKTSNAPIFGGLKLDMDNLYS